MEYVYQELSCSLVPLGDIDTIATDFTAVVKGVSQAVLTQLQYDKQGKVSTLTSGNLLSDLVEENQRPSTRRLVPQGAQFQLQLTETHQVVQLDLSANQPPVLRYQDSENPAIIRHSQSIVLAWMTQHGLVHHPKTAPVRCVQNTKKISAGDWMLAGISTVNGLSGTL